MSKEDEDSFWNIVSATYSPNERLALAESIVTATDVTGELYSYNLVSGARQSLIEMFHLVLDGYQGLSIIDDRWQNIMNVFDQEIASVLGIEYGNPILLTETKIFADQDGIGVLENNERLVGEFAGLSIMPRYDIETDQSGEVPTVAMSGEPGLYINLDNAHVLNGSGEVEYQLLGMAQASLINGSPELFQWK